jgi:hypothetical protein
MIGVLPSPLRHASPRPGQEARPRTGANRYPWLAFVPRAALLARLLLFPIATHAQDCTSPASGDDGWKIAAPDTVGLDPEQLCAVVPRFDA